MDVKIASSLLVPVARIQADTFIGHGKVRELKELAVAENAGLVILDCTLSPIQQRNLEKAWDVKVIDRTALILEIFGHRARTREGVLQVELAHLEYQRGRLVRSWTHLERQRGGFGFLGGPGERQIEADRRLIGERIKRLKSLLEEVRRTRTLQRRARTAVPYPTASLVGYTNAGKSTLFNRLVGAEVPVSDMLFATLDPTMRVLKLPSGRKLIVSDTVGFISELPTELIAAFRATLEEVIEADLVLHIEDAANPDARLQRQAVNKILESMGVHQDGPEIFLIRNKVDLLTVAPRPENAGAIYCSAATGEGVDELLVALDGALAHHERRFAVSLPVGAGKARAWLHRNAQVLKEEVADDRLRIAVRIAPRLQGHFQKHFAADLKGHAGAAS
jgi:GTP-binding protein HflX